MKDSALNPAHPGEILLKDFLKPLAISQYRLAKDVHVPTDRGSTPQSTPSLRP
jgi:antitoxin HigA-1